MRNSFPILLSVALSVAAPLPLLAESSAPAPKAEASLPAISVIRLDKRELTDRVFASGLVGPVETVLVQPQIQGQAIEEISAEVGDKVVAGQVLARLSTTELELQRAQLEAQKASAGAAIAQAEAQQVQAKASADEASRAAERGRKLREGGNLSQAQLDQYEAAETTAKAQLAVAGEAMTAAGAQLKLIDAQIANIDLQLKRADVVAPVSGEIVEKNVMIGAIASSSGTAMFTIIRDGSLELLADVAEQDLLKLAPGQPVTLRFVGASRPVTGEVRLVEPQVDTSTRLGRVRIAILDPAQARAGMFADAEIIVDRRETLAAPVSATSSNDAGTRALKVTDGLVKQVEIETGIRDGAWVEITSGLSVGDEIVQKAGAFVRDGDRINPVPAEARVAVTE